MHNVYDESMENPTFIFFWNQETLYTNMVIQDNTFHDLRDPKGQHGASVTTYAVTNSLYEDNHAYDIDGRGVNEKVGGKRNTFRNNVFHNIRGYQGVVLNSNPSSDSTEICYNLMYDCSGGGIQIGLNGAYVANIFVHHNTIIGSINLSGVTNPAQSKNINIYNNIVSYGEKKPYSISPIRMVDTNGAFSHYEYPKWFQNSDPRVSFDDNLIWTTGSFIAGYGWGIPGTTWAQWQAHGYDVNGILANPGLDENYALPTTSSYYGIYGRDYNNVVTEVKFNEKGNSDWKTYTLSQNYPNPFNPSTMINYQLPMNSNVSLKIFDILGREVITLVNEHKPAGNYTVEWNGTNSAGQKVGSGIYFYQLKTGSGFVETKKMLLLR